MSETTRVEVAERAARAGAAVAADAFRTDLDVETKRGKNDLVTDADRRAQRRVVEVIERSRPDETVIGEEEGLGSTLPAEGTAWIVDPIDGTTNYVYGSPLWTTSVASVRDGRAVAAANVMRAYGDAYVAAPDGFTLNGEPATVSDRRDPGTLVIAPTMGWGRNDREGIASICGVLGDRFGDLRRFATGQTTLSMVAAGQLDGALTISGGDPWDRVGGVYMVEQAGGVVTDLRGDPWERDATGLVASNGVAHDELLDVVPEIRECCNAGIPDG